MQDSLAESSQDISKNDLGKPKVSDARNAGLLLVATALLTLLSVAARVSADADQPTLSESLAAIAESRILYGLGGAARIASGVTLIAGAWFLVAAWTTSQGKAIPLVPWLLGASGIFTAASGLCAVALALVASTSAEPGAFVEITAFLRWFTGKLGFTAAGLALLAASPYLWMARGALRFVAPFSVVIGAAMLLIWLDTLTSIHRFSGVAFVLWLLTMGFLLFAARAERSLNASPDSSAAE